MAHAHQHGPPAATAHSAGGRFLAPLTAALAIGLGFFAVELTVGLVSGSLALLSDAAHLLTDVIGTALAVVAILLGRRGQRSTRHTFGMYRAEVLAALANAVLLFGVAGYVLVEAVSRLRHPPEVAGLPVLLTAAVGLAANLVCFALLRRGAGESLNVRGAYLEVLADLIGSVGVLLSGAVTLLTHWRYADPIVGVAIGLWVLPRTWTLARQALRILFQHAPERLDVDSMAADLGALTGVVEVHDLHVWTLTSGMEVVSAHLAVAPDTGTDTVLRSAQDLLATHYRIEHATLQVEPGTSTQHCHELRW
ncbi:MAG TPA: cation diffusion facilitator family transporter [Pseudonocardiaceae bacterium]|nr:cation diffusion facilitator family transporter [Pseudonocardiaceae bacterium]